MVRADRKAHFGYTLRPSSTSPSEYAQHLQTQEEISSPQVTTDINYDDYPAIKIEANVDLREDGKWRDIFYIFNANNATYAVDAGTTVDEWDKGGKEMVANLLRSVVVLQQPVVLDPFPTPTP
jgi:hypothetical protein